MREIRFRGKREDDDEWVYGFYSIIRFPDDDTSRIATIFGRTWLVDPATVGQYTGMRDTNNKKIYEGDIVQVWKNGKEIYKALAEYTQNNDAWIIRHTINTYTCPDFEDCDKEVCPHEGRTCALSFSLPVNKEMDIKIEVIGNIHDNPELLEVE